MLGSSARKSFFTDPGLDMQEGYQILMGGSPQIEEIDIKPDHVDNVSEFVKRLNLLLKRDRITESEYRLNLQHYALVYESFLLLW